MARLTVIGIGSPFADDRAGWNVVETLITSRQIAAYGERVAATVCRSPATELLGLLANTDIAIVVDAMRFCGAPGTVYRLEGMHIPLLTTKALSSHGMDLRSILALADTLAYSPRSTIIYGIETGPNIEAASRMCQSVRRSVAHVVEDIKRDIENFCMHK
jgi:hydrogenase maturation protease